MTVKERDDAVPCAICGTPTWSAVALCHTCARGDSDDSSPIEPARSPAPVDWPEAWTRRDRCPVCTYDLRGIPLDHACPECGFEGDASTLVVPCLLSTVTPRLSLLIAYGLIIAVLVPSQLRGLTTGLLDFGTALRDMGLPIFMTAVFVRLLIVYVKRRRGESQARLILTKDRLVVAGAGARSVPWSKVRTPLMRPVKGGLHITLKVPWKPADLVFTHVRTLLVTADRHAVGRLIIEIESRCRTAEPRLS